jgi:hypothetical protein
MSESKIIEYLLRYRPSSDWICAQSNLPYLKLNMVVPTSDIYTEWQVVSRQAVPHRSDDHYGKVTNMGWKSLSLYGVSATDTVASRGNLTWTTVAEQCPKTMQWLNDNFTINETTGRIRFMLLEPKGFIVLHKDRDKKGLSEINISITNPDGCRFRFKNYGTVPFNQGDAFLMDVSNEHFVYNGSNNPRLHIIVHSKLKNEKLIAESYANSYYS